MTAYDIRPQEEFERLKNVAEPPHDHNLKLGIWKHIKKNGEIIDVEISTHNIDYNGINARLVLCDGVTERVLAENEIKKLNKAISNSEEKFRFIIENNRDIITLINDRFEIIYRSPSAIAITGFTDAEIEERIKRKELINQVHPDDQAYVLQTNKKVMETSNVPIPISFRSLHKDGYYIWLEGTMTNHLANDKLNAIVQNLHDVTEKKYAEIQLINSHYLLKKLTEKIPIAILKMETNYLGKVKFLFVSKGIQNIYPNFKQEDILANGEIITDHIIEEDKKLFYINFLNSLRTLEDLNIEFRILVDKTPKWVKLFYHPEIQDDGIVKWYGFLEDINFQKSVQLDLEKQNNQLKDIAWTQSHLVRGPLSRIMGLVAALKRKTLSEDYHEKFIDHIHDSTIELDKVIREITNKTVFK